MTRRERVINTIQHKGGGMVPYHADFTGIQLDRMIQYTGNPDFKNSFGGHIDIGYATDFVQTIEGCPGYFRDEFGVVWDRRDGADFGVVSKYVLHEPVPGQYDFPKPVEDTIRANMAALVNSGKDTFKAVNVGFTLYERAWAMRGIEDLLVDMIDEEDFVIDLMEKITQYNLAVMDIALEFEGFDAFFFGDDWGQQKGLIMGIERWRKYLKPGMAKVFAYAKKHGKFNLFHSCGDIHELFPELIDIGMDVYETFQPEIYDIRQIKKSYGRDLTFLGGISTQCLLPFAAPDEIRKTIKETMDIMSTDGGYIVAPTHAIPPDVPPENVIAMLEAFQNQA